MWTTYWDKNKAPLTDEWIKMWYTQMCIYTYTYTHTHTYTYIHTHTHTYIYTYIYIYIHIYTYIHIHIYIYIYTHTHIQYICVYSHTHVCIPHLICIYMYIYTLEYYSAIKRNEVMSFAATWMDIEIIVLSEISWTEKDKHHMISLTCGI